MKDKNTTQEADEILSDASDYASREFASTDLSDKRKDVFIKARTARKIQITGDNAAKEYYKETGRHFDNYDGTEAYIRIIAMSFAYAIMALLVNLILYLPVNYLATSWGEVNSHDAAYITIIINTVISTILVGISTEISTKRKAFIAGMHAEASDHVVGEYHEANTKLHAHK
jgi:hypothetical protein